MATLTTQNVTRAGVTPSYASCAGGGDRFTPGAYTFLHVKNASGGALTVTPAATQVPGPNLTESMAPVSVGAGSEKMIGPLPPQVFSAVDGSGLADVAYSGVTSLTIAVINVSQP